MESIEADKKEMKGESRFLHQIDQSEEDALNVGTLSLAKALEIEARNAASNPHYLDKNYGRVCADLHVPINDGSGDSIYLRGILLGVEINKNAEPAPLTFDDYRKQQILPAAEEALQRMRFTGKVLGPVTLSIFDTTNETAGVSAQIADVEAFRMSKNSELPQALAESIASDSFPLVIDQPTRERWLNALHNDSIRISKTSEQFQSELKEKLADYQAKGMMPQTEILPGAVIDIHLFDSNRNATAEIIASPDKPTSYRQF
jgi:hypothetical protein